MNPVKTESRKIKAGRNGKVLTAIWLIVLSIGVVGCSGEKPVGAGKHLPTFRTKGTVIYKGEPVDDATVSFHPATSGAPGAVGKSNSAGEYTLRTYKAGDGAPEGDYIVTVQKSEIAPAEKKSGAEMFQEMEKQALTGKKPVEDRPLSLIPDKYARPTTSGLSAKVTANGPNEFDLKLQD
jgi:hypothetical protein